MYTNPTQFFSKKTSVINQKIELPRLMHFIWVDPSIMPNDGIRLISEWSQANPGFQLWIWVDFKQFFNLKVNLTKEQVEAFIIEEYQKAFDKFEVKVFFSTCDEKLKYSKAPIIIKDIWLENMASENEYYEMYQLNPSWGLPSDSLRLKILTAYGGAYADCRDIRKGTTSLESSNIFVTGNIHKLLLDHKPQEEEISEVELADFELDFINNDFLISTKNNPAVMQFSQAVEKNYNFDQYTPVETIFERAYGNLHKFYLTLSTTGGTLISNQLLAMNPQPVKKGNNTVKYTFQIKQEKVEIHPVRCLQYCIYKPEGNKLSWLYTPVVTSEDQETALKTVEWTVKFEIERFKILRLDDHSKQLAQALSLDVEASARLILEKILSKIDLSSVDIWVVQCTHQIKVTEKFCKENQLFEKTFFSLKDPLCEHIIQFACNHKYLNKDLWPDLNGSDTVEGYFNVNYSLEQARVLLYHLTESVNLIRSLINVSNISSDMELFKDTIKRNLTLCLEVIDLLYKIFDKVCSSPYLDNFSAVEKELYFKAYQQTMTINREISCVLDKINTADTNNNNVYLFSNFKL